MESIRAENMQRDILFFNQGPLALIVAHSDHQTTPNPPPI